MNIVNCALCSTLKCTELNVPREADGVDGAYELPAGGRDGVEHRGRDARHDVHRKHDVRGVGELHAVFGERGAERAHREREHVHDAAGHRARETLRELGRQLLEAHPLRKLPAHAGRHVRHRRIPLTRRDPRLTLDTRHVVRVCVAHDAAHTVNTFHDIRVC